MRYLFIVLDQLTTGVALFGKYLNSLVNGCFLLIHTYNVFRNIAFATKLFLYYLKNIDNNDYD